MTLKEKVERREQERVHRWSLMADDVKRLYAADVAARVLHYFEAALLNDFRPREAITAARSNPSDGSKEAGLAAIAAAEAVKAKAERLRTDYKVDASRYHSAEHAALACAMAAAGPSLRHVEYNAEVAIACGTPAGQHIALEYEWWKRRAELYAEKGAAVDPWPLPEVLVKADGSPIWA